MRKLFFLTVFIILLSAAAFGQTRRAAVKPVSKIPVKAEVTGEIPPAEWQKLADALQGENWETASALAQIDLAKLKAENEKKQLAQLNYIYLYSLAGRVAEGKTPFVELEQTAQTFVGKNFLMVSRQILANCETKVNYICGQKDSRRILRVTSTNQSGNAIHFFEYTKLDEPFDVAANSERVAFIGGNLTKVETVAHQSGAKFLRLIFDKGYIKVATD